MGFCFNELTKLSLTSFGLDSVHYVELPAYGKDCWLKIIVVNLDTILDILMK